GRARWARAEAVGSGGARRRRCAPPGSWGEPLASPPIVTQGSDKRTGIGRIARAVGAGSPWGMLDECTDWRDARRSGGGCRDLSSRIGPGQQKGRAAQPRGRATKLESDRRQGSGGRRAARQKAARSRAKGERLLQSNERYEGPVCADQCRQ